MLPVKTILYTFVEGGFYDGAQVVRVELGGESPLSVPDLLALIRESLPALPLVEIIVEDWEPIDDDSLLTLCASLRDSEVRVILQVPETTVKPVFSMIPYLRVVLSGNVWPTFHANELLLDFATDLQEPAIGKSNSETAFLYLHASSLSGISKDVLAWLKNAKAQWRLHPSRGTIAVSIRSE